MSFENKVALITGASRGLGQAMALSLGHQGAYVVGTATSRAGADMISQNFETAGIQGKGYVLDVNQSETLDALLADIQNSVGTPQILVNNAAITQDNLFMRMKDEEWQAVIDTNLNAVFRVCKAIIRPMIKARWGRIINITSVVALTGNAGQTNYAAAKAGMIGFTKSLAKEVASRGITANCVAPGFIDTDMTRSLADKHKEALLQIIPMSRMGTPEDIAAAVSFLASDSAAYITGETLNVNGGMYMT